MFRTAVSLSAFQKASSRVTVALLPLIALAIMQGGLLLAAQAPARRWLAGRAAWTATVAMNGSIMTLFIWHLTATTLVVLAASKHRRKQSSCPLSAKRGL